MKDLAYSQPFSPNTPGWTAAGTLINAFCGCLGRFLESEVFLRWGGLGGLALVECFPC